MRPEDQLDALLDQRLSGRTQRSSVAEELKPLLSAAAQLDAFRDAAPSNVFSRNLEARLLARMAQPAEPTPLREQPSAPARQPVDIRHGIVSLRTRAAWAGIAAALLVTIGLGALTVKAAPGGLLWQFAQSITARALPSSSVDATALVDQLRADLAAYDLALGRGDTSTALSSLEKLRTDDQHATHAINTISDAKALAAAQKQLAAFHASANSDLHASLAQLSVQGRAQVTDLLREWGFTTLAVTRVHISGDSRSTSHDSHDSTGSAGASSASYVLVDVHGTGFGQGTKVLINGQSFGSVSTVTSTEISVRAPQSALGGGHVVIGVENADDTVAFATSVERDDQASSGEAATPGSTSKDSGHETPSPIVTPSNEGGSNPNP